MENEKIHNHGVVKEGRIFRKPSGDQTMVTAPPRGVPVSRPGEGEQEDQSL